MFSQGFNFTFGSFYPVDTTELLQSDSRDELADVQDGITSTSLDDKFDAAQVIS